VQLDGRQGELLCDFRVSDLAGLFERHALDPLRHVGGRGDGRAAAKGLELDVRDDALRLRWFPVLALRKWTDLVVDLNL
jgi:hypothetical protein